MEEREHDVSTVSLEETVRIPLGQWPDSLLVTVAGLRKEILAVELLPKVISYGGTSLPQETGIDQYCLRGSRAIFCFGRGRTAKKKGIGLA